jgi:hypothetical protein
MNTTNQFHFTDWSILVDKKEKNMIKKNDTNVADNIGLILFRKKNKIHWCKSNHKQLKISLPLTRSFNVKLIIFISVSIFLDQFSTSPNSLKLNLHLAKFFHA